eukprot:1145191-Pelagomonas_calceolata.AAC.8
MSEYINHMLLATMNSPKECTRLGMKAMPPILVSPCCCCCGAHAVCLEGMCCNVDVGRGQGLGSNALGPQGKRHKAFLYASSFLGRKSRLGRQARQDTRGSSPPLTGGPPAAAAAAAAVAVAACVGCLSPRQLASLAAGGHAG